MILKFIKSGYEKVKSTLSRTGSLLGSRLRALFGGTLDEEALDDLEKLLYEADLGVATAQDLVKKVREAKAKQPDLTPDALIDLVQKELLQILKQDAPQQSIGSPHIILVVGVNGNGKTTSIAKLAHLYQVEGKKVLIGAADTFRAAAIDQLETWANRLGVDLVKSAPNADPAAVAFDAVTAGKARGADVILIDTAGRLHNKAPLMQELEKIRRSIRKVEPTGPHETLLVLDATAGQNGVDQALAFSRVTPLTGLVLTKLDGTAKGGTIVAIHRELSLPVQFIGVGEGIEDLIPFNADSFVRTLLV